MLKLFSSMLCISRIHPFSLGNLMIIRVTSVAWTWQRYLKSNGDCDFG
jgi:hypothetical protein